MRDALAEDECSTPGMEVVALTIVFDHHASDLQEKLHAIQHDYLNPSSVRARISTRTIA
ncbi:MAG: hypothetical protein ACLTMP_03440 [Eggerthella lenta]